MAYYVEHGKKNKFDEIEFYDMGNVEIPCYIKDISFHVKINGNTVGTTQDLSLYDVTSSLDATLVIELFNSYRKWNGWILITSNDNQCFDDKDKKIAKYQSKYSGITEMMEPFTTSTTTTSSSPYTSSPYRMMSSTVHLTKVRSEKDKPNSQQINIEASEFVEDDSGFTDEESIEDKTITEFNGFEQEVLELNHYLIEEDENIDIDVMVTSTWNSTQLYLTQHTINNATKVVSFEHVCSGFVDINPSFWNQDYINDNYRNITKIQCVETKLIIFHFFF